MTFVDENATIPNEAETPNFPMRGGRGGRGGRGRGGFGGPGRFGGPGCGGPGGIPGMKKLFKTFLGEADVDLDFMNGPKKGKDPKEFMGNMLNAFDKFQKSGKLEEIMK